MNNSIIHLSSNPPVYKYAPTWEFSLFEKKIEDQSLINEISRYLLKEEKNIIKKYKVNIPPGSFVLNEMSARYMMYNLFDYARNIDCIIELKKYIKTYFVEYVTSIEGSYKYNPYIACWFIILNPGEILPAHRHDNYEYSFLSGNLIISCELSSTEYFLPYDQGVYPIKNENGLMTIFPSHILHQTTEHIGNKKRISIGFDIKPTIEDCPDIYKHRYVIL